MWKYFCFVLILVCLWFICADWGVSKIDAERLQNKINILEANTLILTKDLELLNKRTPEYKKWPEKNIVNVKPLQRGR